MSVNINTTNHICEFSKHCEFGVYAYRMIGRPEAKQLIELRAAGRICDQHALFVRAMIERLSVCSCCGHVDTTLVDAWDAAERQLKAKGLLCRS